MKFRDVAAVVGDVPFISRKNGRYLYDLILREKPRDILELGIAHGTATCYMAAALQELGRGSVTAVDLLEAKDSYDPSAEEQLAATGLGDFAAVTRMRTGYTWFLHDEIVRGTRNGVCHDCYDLCIIDGPKNWTIDGAAFFFVDKLLRKDGWIIFDDYNWTYAGADERRTATDGITHRSLSEEERVTPHVRDVFELLVKQHPNYGNLIVLDDDDWALAQKTMVQDKSYTIVNRTTTKALAARVARRLYRKARRVVGADAT